MPPSFKLNSRVEVKFVGEIESINRDGTYDVSTKNGTIFERISTKYLSDAGKDQFPKCPLGMVVEANYKNRGVWSRARINENHDVLELEYENGKFESNPRLSQIRFIFEDNKSSPRETRTVNKESKNFIQENFSFDIDQEVEVNFRSKGKWLTSQIISRRGPQTYDVINEDGVIERQVHSSLIRFPLKLYNGPKVEVKDVKGIWFTGRVSGETYNGYFQVTLEDDSSKVLVTKGSIRPFGKKMTKQDQPSHQKFTKGEVVESNYKNQGTYFPGIIRLIRTDGSFDVEYEDGIIERNVTDIKKASSSKGDSESEASSDRSSSQHSSVLKYRGPKVEALDRNSGDWKEGRVTGETSDGFFEITFEDSENEAVLVSKESIRLMKAPQHRAQQPATQSQAQSHSQPAAREVQAKSVDKKPTFKVGDCVSGNYRGEGKWYSGKIALVRTDDSYDIEYDNGIVDMRVPEENLKKISNPIRDASPIRDTTNNKGKEQTKELGKEKMKSDDRKLEGNSFTTFSIGDQVEANFKREGVWFRGTIRTVRSNGAFDIKFDDGEEEKNVSVECIRFARQAKEAIKEAIKEAQSSSSSSKEVVQKSRSTSPFKRMVSDSSK